MICLLLWHRYPIQYDYSIYEHNLYNKEFQPAASTESYVPDPEPFSGDCSLCRGFLHQCAMVFTQRPQTFASDPAKVRYILGLLSGRALS